MEEKDEERMGMQGSMFNNGGFCFGEGLRERKEKSSREEREKEGKMKSAWSPIRC